jgi:hypothetical protein
MIQPAMNDRTPPPLLTYNLRGRGLLQRVAITLVAAAFVVVAFFFITAALIAGALLAAVIALRFWWVMRKVRAAQRAAGPLDGEYTVVQPSGSDRLPR